MVIQGITSDKVSRTIIVCRWGTILAPMPGCLSGMADGRHGSSACAKTWILPILYPPFLSYLKIENKKDREKRGQQ